jgi:aryl-alcohol dehydrogenase-like predicted oxidoreductase
MQTVTLGATGLEVTSLAYGTWQFGGDWGPVDERAATTAIQHARSLGINLFDTAQAYGFGRSERLLGQALAADLRSARDSVVILRGCAARRGATIGQLAVAWVLANPAVQVAIVGARTPAHLDQSLGALDLALSQTDLAEIDQIMAAAVPVGGPTPEGMS